MIEVVYFKITAEDLPYNQGLKQSDIGRFGVAEKGSRRVIEICESESSANEVVELVMKCQQESKSETHSFL